MAEIMELQELPDGGGNTLTVLNYNGRLFPDFDRDAIRGVATFNARPDDVIVCAYPKSGTHWAWEMVRLLLAGTIDIPVLEKDCGMIEFIVPEELEKLPSPRALNSHVHFELLPPDVLTRKSKLVYVSRDPRDIGVSYYHHHKKLVEYYTYSGQWKDYFNLYLSGKVDYESWFAYTKGWEKGIKDNADSLPVFVTSYEALQQDTKSELRRLAKFLGVEVEDSFLNQVLHRCHFDTMKASKGQMETFEESGSPIMYRKGKVGDWKNYFTIAQWEEFEKVFEKEMIGTQAYDLYSVKSKTGHGSGNI